MYVWLRTARNCEDKVEVSKSENKQETEEIIRRKAYFIWEDHRAVVRLNEEPPLLGSDALVHILHREADVVGEVTEGFLDVDHPPPGIGH